MRSEEHTSELQSRQYLLCRFFFNDTATTEIYTLSLHDALPICDVDDRRVQDGHDRAEDDHHRDPLDVRFDRDRLGGCGGCGGAHAAGFGSFDDKSFDTKVTYEIGRAHV